MADVTITTEDAERLVREGGVVNRSSAAPDDLPQWYACVECDHRMRQTQPHLTPNAHYAHDPSGIGGGWHDVKRDGPIPFTAWVAERVDRCTCGCGGSLGHEPGCGLEEVGKASVVDVHHAETCAHRVGRVIADVAYCHPDAKGGRWHWTVEATP